MELRHVKPCELDLSLGRLRQMPEAAVQEKTESLRRKGQLSPLVAAEHDGVLTLVDGFIRHLAATRLGLATVLVEVVELSAVQMKAQIFLRNQDRGLQLLEECRLVRELIEVDGLSQVEVGEMLERHKSWVCRRLGLYRDLSPHLLDDVAITRLEPGSLRRLAQLSPRNQEEVVAVSQRDRLGPRETTQFLELWRRAPDGEARRYLLEHPREALRQASRPKDAPSDPRLGEAGRQLLESLMALRGVSLRLARRLRDGVGELPSEGVRLLFEAKNQAEHDCQAALRAVTGWLAKAGGER